MNTGGKTVYVNSDRIPYARQTVDDGDVEAVCGALRSGWLTTGPRVTAFEEAFSAAVGCAHAVAVSSGTAALHCAVHACGVGPGDEVIVPAITFVATANSVLYCGGKPVFADVDPDTLLLNPEDVRRRITKRTRAILAVDYAGQPCDYDALGAVAAEHDLSLIADACHSLGASYKGRSVGTLADITVFSFHPVKHITTGEGGMVTSSDADMAQRVRRFRNHGIARDHHERRRSGDWSYQMVELGFNYRLSDLNCALGISQLKKLPEWVSRRRAIADRYLNAFQDCRSVVPLHVCRDVVHSFHLFVVKVADEASRARAFAHFRQSGIDVNVHYLPVYLHPFYRRYQKTEPGLCPISEAVYNQILSLPMFPGMANGDVERVIRVAGDLDPRAPEPSR